MQVISLATVACAENVSCYLNAYDRCSQVNLFFVGPSIMRASFTLRETTRILTATGVEWRGSLLARALARRAPFASAEQTSVSRE